jgi:hypothetical protein
MEHREKRMPHSGERLICKSCNAAQAGKNALHHQEQGNWRFFGPERELDPVYKQCAAISQWLVGASAP